MKCKFKTLAVEITRKCNRKCSHCMRGMAEKTTISKEIIDRIFDDVEDCENISLMGGEPLLELNMIEYLAEKIINSNWHIQLLQLTTNGTIIDKRLIDTLSSLCSRKNCKALIRISGDTFHNETTSRLAYEAYKNFPKVESVNIELKEKLNSIKYSGRAKQYVSNNTGSLPEGVIGVYLPYISKRRISILNNTVISKLYIASNGNITFDDEITYQELDSLSFGNLLNNTISNLIEQNNNECLITECDWGNIQVIKQYISGINKNYLDNFDVYIESKIGELIFDRILELRNLAHQMFPYVPAQNIIINISSPRDYLFDIKDEINHIYDCFPSKVKNMTNLEWEEWLKETDVGIYEIFLKNKSDFTNETRKNLSVYAAFKNIDLMNQALIDDICTYSNYFRLVTSKDSINSFEFLRLKMLNEKYKVGEIKFSNNRFLSHNIGDSIIGEPNRYEAVFQYLLKEGGIL